jgi:hypothetical protein
MKRPFSALLQPLRQRLSGHNPALPDAAGDSPARRLVDNILRDATNRRASEIQIGLWTRAETGLGPESEIARIVAAGEGDQEGEDIRSAGREFAVRYRIAGELHTTMSAPRPLYPAIVARLKEMAGLTLAARSQQSDLKRQASQNAPRGHISLRFSGYDGSDVLADFDVAIVTEDKEEKVLLNINYKESLRKRIRPVGVTLIAASLFVGMLMGVALLVEPMANGSKVAAALMVGYTLATGTIAVGLLRLKEWARRVTQVVFAAGSAIVAFLLAMVILNALMYGEAFEDPLETALYGGIGLVSLLFLLYLHRPGVKGAFGTRRQP